MCAQRVVYCHLLCAFNAVSRMSYEPLRRDAVRFANRMRFKFVAPRHYDVS
jgi:hypothetical protein